MSTIMPQPNENVPEPTRAPLSGRSVCVTRAADQAHEFMAMLSALGARPVAVPTIEIVSPPDETIIERCIEQLSTYEWIIFTSVNAVDRFFAYLAASGQTQIPDSIRCAVVGTATAARLATYHVAPSLLPQDYKAEGLISEFEELVSSQTEAGLIIEGQKVLMPRALVAREILPERLRELGFVVDIAPVYQTVPARFTNEVIDSLVFEGAQHACDAITFTSPSTARYFFQACSLAQVDPLHVLKNSAVFSIGAVTTAELKRLDYEGIIIEPEESTVKSLLDALVAHFKA